MSRVMYSFDLPGNIATAPGGSVRANAARLPRYSASVMPPTADPAVPFELEFRTWTCRRLPGALAAIAPHSHAAPNNPRTGALRRCHNACMPARPPPPHTAVAAILCVIGSMQHWASKRDARVAHCLADPNIKLHTLHLKTL